MKVYVVSFQRFENAPPRILGVCSTKEKAESVLPADPNERYWWDVQEFELDDVSVP